MAFSVRAPTPCPALNSVLDHFVTRAREVLADNFVGAWLQGSFALGDFDEPSDVDFLVVVSDDIADAQVAPADRALWLLDHGSRPLERSRHDDTCVVRWLTREKGIVLAGPGPRLLIDEVSGEAPRREMRDTMAVWPATRFPDAESIHAGVG